MAIRKDRRRVGKEQLAMAVRKNFNGLAIQEGEVVVDFLYKVMWQGKCLFFHRLLVSPGWELLFMLRCNEMTDLTGT
jgi:hypothetical protein